MQEAIDLYIVTIQSLTTEKLDAETRAKADQRKAEDVRLLHHHAYGIFDVFFFFFQDRFEMD